MSRLSSSSSVYRYVCLYIFPKQRRNASFYIYRNSQVSDQMLADVGSSTYMYRHKHMYVAINLVLARIQVQEHTHTHAQNSFRYGVYGVASPLRALQRQRQKQKYQSRLEQSILGQQDTPWASARGSLSFSLLLLLALTLFFLFTFFFPPACFPSCSISLFCILSPH